MTDEEEMQEWAERIKSMGIEDSPMNDAPTPETDSILEIASIEDRYLPLLRISRKLERERDQARAELAKWKEKACVLESQVENADVNLEQVRLNYV